LGVAQGRHTYCQFLQHRTEEGIVLGQARQNLVVMTAEVDENGDGILGYWLVGDISTMLGRSLDGARG
jgi:hypothetical protein